MKLPSIPECFRLIREMGMMDHIIDHSVMVSNVAICIARSLSASGHSVNIQMIRSASLLHDITKTRSFETGEVHSETGGSFLTEKGWPEIGNIVRQHVILDTCSDRTPISETEIVNYADKRVLHDKVVSLKSRLAYIEERYGRNPDLRTRIRTMWDSTLMLEQKLFKRIKFSPDDLSCHIVAEVVRSDRAGQPTT